MRLQKQKMKPGWKIGPEHSQNVNVSFSILLEKKPNKNQLCNGLFAQFYLLV